MQLRNIHLDPRSLRDALFYAAVLIIPGGSLIALGVWLFGRLSHRTRPAVMAAQPVMGPEPALFVYAPGVSDGAGLQAAACAADV